MSDLKIELKGEQFRRAYLLYVIKVAHNERGDFYYVGQTGDNRYTTARPAFRRLSGHMEDTGQSTQNQVYRYIATKVLGHEEAEEKKALTEDVKQSVEDFLVGSTVQMHIYQAEGFSPGVHHEKHLEIVRRVTQLERHVIRAFIDSERTLMNKKVTRPKGDCPYPRVLRHIRSDFGLISEDN